MMGRKPTSVRTMDIHLLTRVADDGSPFGVEYSTRRLILGSSGQVSCDVPADTVWQEMSTGIPGPEIEKGELVMPSDGSRFLDASADYFRYHFLSPLTPLVYDRRGAARPDNFRIIWKSSTNLIWAHGYQILCDGSGSIKMDSLPGLQPVARIPEWTFLHEFRETIARAEECRPPQPRVVAVDLLPQRNTGWKDTALGSSAGPRETKMFIRAFLRRFFERQSAGIELDFASGISRSGRFAWRGGF